jgi:chromosome segregation ATPase
LHFGTGQGKVCAMSRACNEEHLAAAVVELTDVLRQLLAAVNQDTKNKAVLQRIAEMESKIMATSAELAADLKLVLAQQQKTAGEIASVQTSVDALKAQIVDLEGQISVGGTVSQELVDAVAAVKAQAQVVDDLIPDLPTPPAP